jgi:hypothetical protein
MPVVDSGVDRLFIGEWGGWRVIRYRRDRLGPAGRSLRLPGGDTGFALTSPSVDLLRSLAQSYGFGVIPFEQIRDLIRGLPRCCSRALICRFMVGVTPGRSRPHSAPRLAPRDF